MKKGDPFCLSNGCNDTISCHFFECFPQHLFLKQARLLQFILLRGCISKSTSYTLLAVVQKSNMFFFQRDPRWEKKLITNHLSLAVYD